MTSSGEMRCEITAPVSRLAIPFAPTVAKARRSSRCLRARLRGLSAWKWPLAVAAAALPVLAEAQIATDIGRAPTLTIERYPERWSHLADPAKRTGHWTERFKYIPLSADGSTYLTTGVEIRSRYEGYANVSWGAAPDDGYVWHRFMPYVDFHAGKLRLFAQPMASGISGLRRAKRPIDTTSADVLQAFVEIEMDVAETTSLRMSAGRKLVSLGAGRFIDTRYGPNIPQAFDGVDVALTGKDWQLTGLYFRPVDNRLDYFDDRTSSQKAIWGAYATKWLSPNRTTGFDVFYLGLRDRNAVYDQGPGKELVHTFGTRLFGDDGSSYWNLEAAVQHGTFAGHRRAAWGVGGEIGHRFLRIPLQPDFRLTADVISGDDDPDDPALGTFNPLFPRGKYFASQSPIGPRNLIHVRPSVTLRPHEDIELSLSGTAYWRQSTDDGIYAISGALVRSGQDSDARFIGTQAEFAVAWQASPELNLSASVGVFDPGTFIQDTGPAQLIKLIGVMANYRF